MFLHSFNKCSSPSLLKAHTPQGGSLNASHPTRVFSPVPVFTPLGSPYHHISFLIPDDSQSKSLEELNEDTAFDLQ